MIEPPRRQDAKGGEELACTLHQIAFLFFPSPLGVLGVLAVRI
jgi:hypothetical protein